MKVKMEKKITDTKKKKKKNETRVPFMVQWITNPTSIHENTGSIPCLVQLVKDPVLLSLWRRPSATALIQTLV